MKRQSALSSDRWRFLPKLFRECGLIRPYLGALPMLAPRRAGKNLKNHKHIFYGFSFLAFLKLF